MGKRGGRWVEREVFLPEPGHVIVAFDLDQVDSRAVAGLCQDPAYMALFTDPSIDSHQEIAYRLWGVRDGKKGVYRNKAKVIGHAWNYGAGINRIVDQTGIPRDDVERFDTGMRSDFPLLVQWKGDMASVAETGALMNNGFGRMMRPNPSKAYTQGPALMGQGAARDLMMGGILRLPVEVVPMLRAVVHDEIVLSIPTDVVHDVIPLVQQALTDEFHGIPITSGYEKPAPNWGQCYRP
jgi:DNA polymerase-1